MEKKIYVEVEKMYEEGVDCDRLVEMVVLETRNIIYKING